MITARPLFLRLPVALLLLCASLTSLRELEQLNREYAQIRGAEREVLYLPNGRAVSALAFGFTNVAAHLLWFRTINYFGKHYASDKNYAWLSHMCSLVTTLSPRSPHVYSFCGTMLAWEARQPGQAVELLKSASVALPQEWRFPYLRGMTYLLFQKDARAAHESFIEAAKKPSAHPIVKRLAAKAIAEAGDTQTAIEFLDDMIAQEQEPHARKALLERRVELLRDLKK